MKSFFLSLFIVVLGFGYTYASYLKCYSETQENFRHLCFEMVEGYVWMSPILFAVIFILVSALFFAYKRMRKVK